MLFRSLRRGLVHWRGVRGVRGQGGSRGRRGGDSGTLEYINTLRGVSSTTALRSSPVIVVVISMRRDGGGNRGHVVRSQVAPIPHLGNILTSRDGPPPNPETKYICVICSVPLPFPKHPSLFYSSATVTMAMPTCIALHDVILTCSSACLVLGLGECLGTVGKNYVSHSRSTLSRAMTGRSRSGRLDNARRL